ncbi:hypothetical protein [Bradyrhizobium sp. USDA 3458]|uniref:hypothetical protein n=1 Tax=Bradyrhizobium sp. USDA 3458 TaxID=2591461 RepID=UPI001143E21B|nr:hypothetical protein [Bradyrhizobium sp. USDA 3458]
MKMTAQYLYQLLPAVYRIRDAEEGYPLRELLGVLAEQAAVLEESIEQLYDDHFIETCAEWVCAYIGELVGYRPLHDVAPSVASPRSEVANVIAYRRRLGTVPMLEQLARDVTGWSARAVEYLPLTATTQRMNHLRPTHHLAPDLRNWRGLESIAGAFDPFTRTVDLRSIARADGRYGFSNIGLHLWRLQAFLREASPATVVDHRRHLFSPLGAPVPLFTLPVSEQRITHIATPLNVPAPISCRALDADLAGESGTAPPRAIYGRDVGGARQSVIVSLDGVELRADEVQACNLADDAGTWAHLPAAGEPVAIDPELGRIALPPDRLGAVSVTYHYGFSAAIGGGSYDRALGFGEPTATRPLLTVPSSNHANIQSALDALPAAGGIVEIADNGRYEEALTIAAAAGAMIELRAANWAQPHLSLSADLTVTGGEGARVTLDGLLVSAFAVVVPASGGNALESLTIRNCTLVPGRSLDSTGQPQQPGAISLNLALPGAKLNMSACISGPLAIAPESEASVEDSILDAAAADPTAAAEGIAYGGPALAGFGGALSLRAVTTFGKLAAVRFDLVSNSILDAKLRGGDAWPAPVWAERQQVGCMRFSFVPRGSITPRRYRCQPQLSIDDAVAARKNATGAAVPQAEREAIAARVARRMLPSFVAHRYGRPTYGQLRRSTPVEIRTGASDEAEQGAFHLLLAPQREANLMIRLEEYLRFSLEAGLFFET